MRTVLVLYCAMGLVPPLVGGCASASATTPGGAPLPPCPDKPNCVSSLEPRPAHAVAPLAFQSHWLTARERLVALLVAMPRTRVTAVEDRYIRAQCRSRFLRFVDDLTFYFDPDQGVIHVRSAARLGYSDLGVNRKRVEAIRRLWAGQGSAAVIRP